MPLRTMHLHTIRRLRWYIIYTLAVLAIVALAPAPAAGVWCFYDTCQALPANIDETLYPPGV
jgi:hypothetical protein